MASAWPELAELRRAASAPGISRFSTAVTSLVSSARVAFAAALLAQRQRTKTSSQKRSASEDVHLAVAVIKGSLHHETILALLALDSPDFAQWKLTNSNVTHLRSQLLQLASLNKAPLPCAPPELPGPVDCAGTRSVFPHACGFFFAALAAGWSWSLALQAFSTLPSGHFSDYTKTFLPVYSGSNRHAWSNSDLCMCRDSIQAKIYLTGSRIALIHASRPMLPLAFREQLPESPKLQEGHLVSLPGFLSLPYDAESSSRILPQITVTAIVERRKEWHTRLCPLDGATAAIVNGHFVYPRDSWDWNPLQTHNHPSWERNAEAKAALGPTFAAWIHSGIVEWIPSSCNPPLIIEPIGAVQKSTPPFWRMISDARRSNTSIGKWPIRCMNLQEMISALDFGAIMCADDVQDAYHLSAFAGCTGELMEDLGLEAGSDGTWRIKRRVYLGCSPRSCFGTCDKARSGCCVEGHVFRFAAAHFGQKLAGSPLNCLLMAVIRHLLRKHILLDHLCPLLCSLWVDDISLAQNVPHHDRCGGLAAQCPVCARALKRFEGPLNYWHSLADKLGIPLSLTKRQNPSQRVEYTGILIDTIACRLFIPDRKLLKLRTALRDLVDASECTTRALLSVRGRVLHYSLCIQYVLPLVPSLSAEGEDPNRLDARLLLSEATKSSLHLVLKMVDDFAPKGASLWPPVPSSLYGAFLRGETAGTNVVVVTWDCSYIGWGATIRSSASQTPTLIVSTWAGNEVRDAQVHRETCGGCLALESASKVLDLHSTTIIMRNDATGALSSLRKGNSHSAVLQAFATRLTCLCASLEATALFLHAPGKTLIAEGVDDASRRLASAIAGPACSVALRNRIFALASQLGWSISVDAFASISNRLVARYFAEFAEPQAEAVDALAVTDWNYSTCSCGKSHREVLFAFPPRVLIRRFIAKARADGIRGIVIVPLAISAAYWPRLLAAAIPVNGSPFVHLRNLRAMLSHADDFSSPALALFAVDFAPFTSRSAEIFFPPCGQEQEWRGRHPLGSSIDQEDRKQIHDVLAGQASPHV